LETISAAPTSARADYRVDIRAGVSVRVIEHLDLARLVHLSVIEPSVHRTVGREDLLSVWGVYAQPRTTGTIQPCIQAARGISAEIAPDLLVAKTAPRCLHTPC
jgi:hypothetical protein